MANEKISALPTHTLNSADIIPVAEGGQNYGDTVGQIETAAAALVHWSALLGNLTETQVIMWDGPTPGTKDTGISRLDVATIGIGNGTPGDYSGEIRAGQFTVFAHGDYLATAYEDIFVVDKNGSYNWSGTSSAANISDTSISRVSANVVQIGNTSGTPDASGTLDLKEIVLTDFGVVPTSSSGSPSGGIVGEIVQHSGVLYFCSATGAAGSATWNVITMTPSV